jgi:hypothetical protein
VLVVGCEVLESNHHHERSGEVKGTVEDLGSKMVGKGAFTCNWVSELL